MNSSSDLSTEGLLQEVPLSTSMNSSTPIARTTNVPSENSLACPESHYWCPGMKREDFYCLPVYTRCNGVKDCPRGQDELNCQDYTCLGHYRYVSFIVQLEKNGMQIVYHILYFYSTLYPIWGEYQIQSLCLCVCVSSDSCLITDLRC